MNEKSTQKKSLCQTRFTLPTFTIVLGYHLFDVLQSYIKPCKIAYYESTLSLYIPQDTNFFYVSSYCFRFSFRIRPGHNLKNNYC